VTPKGQDRDPIIFGAPYLHNGAKSRHGHNGRLIVSRWWQIEWSRDWRC